ncbi:hypothetical protein [Thiohalorhabdus methylotrophus]|uniref:Uncharacterized protein n=1 Tax=Thiohalorhabdus methylotrophus TaxID=3242694 RepID=A0ABV4TV50_9GAMM
MDAGSSSRWTSRLAPVVSLSAARSGGAGPEGREEPGPEPADKVQPAEGPAKPSGRGFSNTLAEQYLARERRRIEAQRERHKLEAGEDPVQHPHPEAPPEPAPGGRTYEYVRGADGRFHLAVEAKAPADSSRRSHPEESGTQQAAGQAPASYSPGRADRRAAAKAYLAAAEPGDRVHRESPPSPRNLRGEAAYQRWESPTGPLEILGRFLNRTI